MTEKGAEPEETGTAKARPGVWEQVVVTLKVLLGTGAVLGGLWLLDTMVS